MLFYACAMICLGAMEAMTGWISGLALSLLVILAPFVLFLTPFFIVPLHFRWQAPKESNVALAFTTGLLSCVLGWALIGTLGVALYIDTGGSI